MKKSHNTAGKGGAKPIGGANAAALKRSKGDAGTSSWMRSKTRSPHKGSNSAYRGCDTKSWGGNVRR